MANRFDGTTYRIVRDIDVVPLPHCLPSWILLLIRREKTALTKGATPLEYTPIQFRYIDRNSPNRIYLGGMFLNLRVFSPRSAGSTDNFEPMERVFMEKIGVNDLQPCDVLLFHGTSFISKMIRLADGEPYNHAAFYVGSDGGTPHVAEMLGDGLNYHPLSESVAGAAYVDVFRYYDDSRIVIGNLTLPCDPVLKREKFYQNEHDRYAYEEILLLALLCSTRHISIPIAGPIIRNILDSAADVVAKLFKTGKQPMICSELVYRCFDESDPKYELHIKGADLAYSQASNLDALLAPSIVAEPSEINEMASLYSDFLQNYLLAKHPFDSSHAKSIITATAAVGDFVTPNDLGRSPNLQKQGTLAT